MREASQSFDAGEIKAQSRRAHLHSQACFRLRLGSQWAIARSGVRATINFTGDTELPVYAKDSRRSIGQHIVLRKQLGRRSQDRNSDIPESVESSVAAKLFSHQYRAIGICLVQSDSARLIGIRQADADAETKRWSAPRFISEFELGPEDEVAGVVAELAPGASDSGMAEAPRVLMLKKFCATPSI